jgi:hypothetical protein
MKPNIRALLDRCISEGIEHTFLNTDVEVSDDAARRFVVSHMTIGLFLFALLSISCRTTTSTFCQSMTVKMTTML